MTGDWIKIHRKILKSAVWEDALTLKVWIWILLNANYRRRQLLSGQWLEPGQLIISQRKLATELRTTHKKLRTCLNRLEKCENLAQEPTHRGTLITVCNWRTYQELDFELGTQKGTLRAQSGHTKGTLRAQEEERQEVQEGKKDKKSEEQKAGANGAPSAVAGGPRKVSVPYHDLLIDTVETWNGFAGPLGGPTLRTDPLRKDLVRAWSRAIDRSLAESLGDQSDFRQALERSEFLRQAVRDRRPWASLVGLLGGNRHGETKLYALLAGAYESRGSRAQDDEPAF